MSNTKIISPESISYSGQVTIKIYDKKRKKIIGTKKIKNNGTLSLFKFLCRCLIDNYESNQRPRYLDASSDIIEMTSKTQIQKFNSCLYYRSILTPSPLLERVEQDTQSSGNIMNSNNVYVKFSAQILRGQLNSSGSDVIKSLVLTSSPDSSDTSSSILAWINLPEEAQIEIGENQTILIEWQLAFNNYLNQGNSY